MTAAADLQPVFETLLGTPLPIAVRLWDGSTIGPESAEATVVMRSPDALRRILYRPNDLGIGRAYVAGELDVEGDTYAALDSLNKAGPVDSRLGPRAWALLARAVVRLGVLGKPLPPPPEEARVRGRLHSIGRDADAVSHHYNVSNEFYRLILGPTMAYSCARFSSAGLSLDEAQEAKFDLICRKLGLEAGMRFLDVGCGWGGMVLHAVGRYGVEGTGITVSEAQRDLAGKRLAEAGLTDRATIRLQDYRELSSEPTRYDAISSIGMFEHVGRKRMAEYFRVLYGALGPQGRLLNHAISTPDGARIGRDTFMARYVFPDGEMQDVGAVIEAMQQVGFEVRDVESLREHYATTLHCWVANLERHWDEAVALVGERRARVWKIYMSGSAVSFERGDIAVHQVLGVRPDEQGRSGMPPTRAAWG
jgi:cyclopropane-fatty-acyl-phospholipid synthase